MEQRTTATIVPPDISQLNRAILCTDGSLKCGELPIDSPGKTRALVEVACVGLCRTDLYAIAGQIPVYDSTFVLGHEFSGKVVAAGSALSPEWIGRIVGVNPVIPCGQCEDCTNQTSHLCCNTKMMGIDLEGACRQVVAVDMMQLFDVGELDAKVAAFAEPVAATLGILNSNIKPDQKGIVLGQGRITELAHRVLKAKGFNNVTVSNSTASSERDSSAFDFVIETGVDADLFREMVRLVKPRGTLVLKSRQITPFELTLRDVVAKQPTIQLVNYGCFEEAVRLLTSGEVIVDDLIGPTFSFAEIDAAIAMANSNESNKVFLSGWS